MKIILSTSMSGLGGTETATLRLGALLAARGHDVLLASSDGPLRREAQAAGMRWAEIDFYGGKTAYLRGMWAFVRLLRREQPDIVHCQMARIVPACALAAKLVAPQCAVFYHARGLAADTYPKIAKLFARLGVYTVANCRHEQEKMIRHGFPRERIAFTYNALLHGGSGAEKTPRGFVRLGTLSRLDKVRAVHRTLPLVSNLLSRGLDVRLHIAGTGAEEAALRQQAQDLGIADKVDFLGAVRDLPAFFAETDILVNTLDCPGDWGAGVGNNILEAGLFQTAVATYDVAGIREMVEDGATGRCLPLYADDALADALAELVQNPDLRAQYGAALHERVTRLCSDDEIYRTTMAAYAMAGKR
ncbi:MAG: glycosyltransferase [Neisseria sp.]|nr:glycosyltransferase [Neisseria sp.]